MNTRTKAATAEEIPAIEDLIGDLERRLRLLSNGAGRETSGASAEIGDFVNDALQRIPVRKRHRKRANR